MNLNDNNTLEQEKTLEVLGVNNDYKSFLKTQKEVQDLTAEINITDMNSIINYGQKSSDGISKVSGKLLDSMQSIKSGEVGEMMNALAKVMGQFDSKDLKQTNQAKGFLRKIFKSAQEALDKMFEKYEKMGAEIDEIAVILKKYENDIKKANDMLKELGEANIEYFRELEKYVVAGEIALEEIDSYIEQYNSNTKISEDEKSIMIQSLNNARDMLSQRIYDLSMTEAVSVQSCAMIQNIRMSNFDLMRKINTSFIITLPVFKQALIQAVMIKRQEIQSNAIKQLDDKTNELLKSNAINTAKQSAAIAKMTSTSTIKIETLEHNHEVIMKGIEEVRAIREQSKSQIAEGMDKLESLNREMKNKLNQS